MPNPKRVLLVASSGGHWVQLLRLRPAVEDYQAIFASTAADNREHVPGAEYHALPDASLWDKFTLLSLAVRVALLVLRVRPAIVLTTGAAPGFFAMLFGKLVGARTIWVDSIANCDEMSLSGKKARCFADLWLTQWEHLARPDGPHYLGKVL